uniref:Glutaredoxin-3 n=2 Tax=Cacopsylla melanoneura TaxID=428564 RepID=A0A8D9BK28_9HEMI
MSVVQITAEPDVEKYAKDKTAVIHFFADWSEECKHMNKLFDELSKDTKYGQIVFAQCVAEDLPKLSLNYKVSAVPTFIILKNLKAVDRVEGADPESLEKKLLQQLNSPTAPTQPLVDPKKALDERLVKLMNRHKVMIFMKGDRNQPRCGFSKTLIQILNETCVPYDTFDILQDDEVRQGLKIYSNWPTYPQVYVKGELIGGLDIIAELKATGELVPTLDPDMKP